MLTASDSDWSALPSRLILSTESAVPVTVPVGTIIKIVTDPAHGDGMVETSSGTKEFWPCLPLTWMCAAPRSWIPV